MLNLIMILFIVVGFAFSAYADPVNLDRQLNVEQFKSDLVAKEKQRERLQGKSVKHLSSRQCDDLFLKMPDDVGQDFLAHIDDYNPYKTPQENWCVQEAVRTRVPMDNTFPGLLPDGAHATYLGNGHWQISQ